MRTTSFILLKSEPFSLHGKNQDLQRQSLGRGWPAKKLITKKQVLKRGKKKSNLLKGRHSNLSYQQNCNLISIEETTQQGINSSSLSKNSEVSQRKELSSTKLTFECKDINSNSSTQRFSELNEYQEAILAHMSKNESKYVPKLIFDPNSISECNRTKLMTWILDLSSRFYFKLETSLSAINIVDRTLGLFKISIQKLPLLGITSLFMATKYEQIMIPHLANFVGAVPEVYKVTKQAILNLESTLLLALDFDLGYASPMLFIHQFTKQNPSCQFIKEKANAIAKNLIISSSCRYWTSSKIATHAIQNAQIQCQGLGVFTVDGIVDAQQSIKV